MKSLELRIKELEEKVRGLKEGSPDWVDNVLELSRMLWTNDGKRSLEISQQALEIAQDLNYERGIALANRNLAMIKYASGTGDPSELYVTLTETLDWFEKNDDKEGIADVNLIFGLFLWAHGEFERGFNHAFNGMGLYKELEKTEALGWTYNTLGGFYLDSKDYNKSKEYHQKAHDLFIDSDHYTGVARSLNGIANAYHLAGELEKAIEIHKNALEYQNEDRFEFTKSRIFNDLGKIKYDCKEYEESLDYHTQSLRIREELEYPHGINTTLMDRGKALAALDRFDEAELDVKRSLEISSKMNAKPKMIRAHKILADVFKRQEKFDRALYHFEEYHNLEDAVHHEDLDTKLANLRKIHQAEFDKKESEIFRLRNVELRQKNDELAETIAQLNATQAQLLQTSKITALAKLAAGVVHEINTPVSAINSSSDLTLSSLNKIKDLYQGLQLDEKDCAQLNKYVEAVILSSKTNKEAAARIHSVANSLKRFAGLDEAVLKKGDVHDSINSALILLSSELHGKVKIEKDFGEIPEILYYRGEFNQVLVNLLLNATQAIDDAGNILIKTRRQNGFITIDIQDDGKGIAEKKLEKLFEPGFTKRDAKTRMRTGLYSSYNIISKHNGHIEVKSELGKGSTFTIKLPMRQN